MKIRLLTLNAGLLELFGREFPTPFVSERARELAIQIESLDCDIVLLQEIYGDTYRRNLAEALKQLLPYPVSPRKKRNFGLQNGLMALSRYPATGSVELFRDAPLDETLFDSKGVLITQHQLPGGTTLTILNLHTTAGGMFNHPESAKIEVFRSRQVQQVIDCANRFKSPLLVAGDLNAGPGVSEVNFQQLLDAGFLSLHDLVSPQSKDVTWDPLNSLNDKGPHKACPPQRIDHVFLRSADYKEKKVRALSSEICLDKPVVKVPGSTAVSISDHYGICVELELSSCG
jgi:endonuclease/exonuclease/phosphatase family metal-dependent hydrolase